MNIHQHHQYIIKSINLSPPYHLIPLLLLIIFFLNQSVLITAMISSSSSKSFSIFTTTQNPNLMRSSVRVIKTGTISSSFSSRVIIDTGVSFSPAGLLSPYHIGAAQQLINYDIINDNTAVSGSSGGALAAIIVALRMNLDDAMKGSNYVAQRCRDEGTRGTLCSALTKILTDLVPEDAHILLQQRPSPCTLGYTEISPILRPQFISTFKDKKDVLEVLLASCNIPFYFNGNNIGMTVRGAYAVDGFFTTDSYRFGCPPTGAVGQEIIVTPFSASLIGLDPYRSRLKIDDCRYDVISSDILIRNGKKHLWPFSVLEILQMALSAPSSRKNPSGIISDEEISEIYEVLYKAGMESVKLWYEEQQR